MIEHITVKGDLLAIIVRSEYREQGINFVTDTGLGQQLAHMNYPAGKTVQAHRHNEHLRPIVKTREVLFIRSGKIRVDLYCREHKLAEQRILSSGDVIMLVDGGHGLEVIEPVDMIEVKQGPFYGTELDKTYLPADTTTPH